MKDASSHPLGYNPNYEEQRKDYVPVQQRNATGKSRKPAAPAGSTNQSPESRGNDEQQATPRSEPHQKP